MRIRVETYITHYHAVCEYPGCGFEATARIAASDTDRDVIRAQVRRHVTATGHSVRIEYGKETVYSPKRLSIPAGVPQGK